MFETLSGILQILNFFIKKVAASQCDFEVSLQILPQIWQKAWTTELGASMEVHDILEV